MEHKRNECKRKIAISSSDIYRDFYSDCFCNAKKFNEEKINK